MPLRIFANAHPPTDILQIICTSLSFDLIALLKYTNAHKRPYNLYYLLYLYLATANKMNFSCAFNIIMNVAFDTKQPVGIGHAIICTIHRIAYEIRYNVDCISCMYKYQLVVILNVPNVIFIWSSIWDMYLKQIWTIVYIKFYCRYLI